MKHAFRSLLAAALCFSLVGTPFAQVVEGPLTAPSMESAAQVEAPAAEVPALSPVLGQATAVGAALSASPERNLEAPASLGSLDSLREPTESLSRALESGSASPESLSNSAAWDRSARLEAINAGESPSLGSAEGFRPQIPTWAKVVGVVTLATGLTLGGFAWHVHHKNDVWKKSKSAALVVEVEKARRAGNAEDLRAIGDEAYSRRDRMTERIKQAESRGEKQVDDKTHDSLDKAKDYRSFDGMVGGRARLNENAVSKDPKTRIGEELPSTWNQRIGAAEQDAVSTGFEGRLALKLQDLQGEIGREEGKRNAIAGDFKEFTDRAPSLFGGNIKMHSERAAADLKEFDQSESAPEESLLAKANGAMRARVSDRIYKESAEFRGHRDHYDKLTALIDRVNPAVQTAQKVDQDLANLEQHLHDRTMYLLLASQHENDTETYIDSDGKERTRTVDNSGWYKMMAASAASDAQASAAAANAGIAALKPMIEQLRRDGALQDEGLTFALIGSAAHSNGAGFLGVWGDLFMPSWVSMFGNFSAESDAARARAKFAPALNGLESVLGELGNRQSGESKWVNAQITTDINGQMQQAKGQSR